MLRLHTTLRAAIGIALLAAQPTPAAPPQVMTYSGYLKTSGGSPVTVATSITFRLYASAGGGASVWSETVSVTPNPDGWFSAVIGTTMPLPFGILNQDLYLSLQVNTDAEFAQRARVTPSPSALTVDWGGVQGKPTCTAGAYLTLDGTTGNLLCQIPPAGGGGVSTVSATTPVNASITGSSLSIGLIACGPGPKILQWDGNTWACTAPAAGFTPPLCGSPGMYMQWSGTAWQCNTVSGGVTAVSAAAPLVVSGTAAAPVIALPTCTAGSMLLSTGTSWECASPSLSGQVASATVTTGASTAHQYIYAATVAAPWSGTCTFATRLVVLGIAAATLGYVQTSPAYRVGATDTASGIVTPLQLVAGFGLASDSWVVQVSRGTSYDLGCHILLDADTAAKSAYCKVTYHCTP